ncbi:major facilitator superfamily domain-containing protein [Xylaria sp. FL0043]|nr:major facilitator superfamily domain-containing protein [Xylaria sp. FL0043]
MDQEDSTQSPGSDGSLYAIRSRGRRSASRYAIRLVLLLLLLVNLTNGISNIPLNRLLERRLCRAYYDSDHDVDEKLCKVDSVQQDLAWIMGSFETLWIVGDFVMTIPLTFLSERYGRSRILLLNLVPRLFMLFWTLSISYFEDYLPPQAAIAGASLSILGGDTVFNSLIYGLAAKITEDSLTRAIYFSRMTALASVIGFLSPAVAAAAMTVKLSLPFWLGTVFLLLAVPTVLLLPVEEDPKDETAEARRPLISSPTLKAQTSRRSLVSSIADRVHSLVSAVGNVQLALLLLSMFLSSLASADTKLLAQYISKRYHWTFASAGYLLSAKAIVNFILLTFVVPLFLTTQGNTSQSLTDGANIRYARFCLISSVFGALAIGFSSVIWELVPSLLIYALGVPLSIFTLSLANSSNMWAGTPNSETEPSSDPQSHIFSIVMMVKTLGSLVGAPLMATLWYNGIRVSFYGSPYIASSLIYLAAWCAFWNIRGSSVATN